METYSQTEKKKKHTYQQREGRRGKLGVGLTDTHNYI